MSYLTITDLESEFSSEDLAKLSGDLTGQVVDMNRINHIIKKVNSLINSYIIGRYPMQGVMPITAILNYIAIELSVCLLFENSYTKRIIPQTILLRKASVIELLEKIQKSEANIAEFEEITNKVPYLTNKTNKQRDFTNDQT